MSISATATSAVLLVVGAAVGVIPTYVIERRKERHALAVRWDLPLYDLCRELTSVTRQFVHLVRRYNRTEDQAAHFKRVDDEHARLRGLVQQIRLLGSRELQQAAREVEHHAWWLREVHEGREDALVSYYGGVEPEVRLRDATLRLLTAARRQLGVKDAEDIAPDDPIDPRHDNTTETR
jgi:hypothetical protein